MTLLLGRTEGLFDRLERRWGSARSLHVSATLLVMTFVAALVIIELNRQGCWPHSISSRLPTNHFHAVDLALALLLVFEVIGLVFTLAKSVSASVGKQFEILSLILVRQSFKELTAFAEPIAWAQVKGSITDMLSVAFGALLIFVVLGFYYRLQRHQPITIDTQDRWSFVAIKKLIALALFVSFAVIAASDLTRHARAMPVYPFFETFYTVLIFSDVLIVLISLRYSSTYRVVFRNSGFAVATVFLRLALTAPHWLKAVLGLAAAFFALGLTVAYNAFAPDLGQAEKRVEPDSQAGPA
jgi:hypothetical protein